MSVCLARKSVKAGQSAVSHWIERLFKKNIQQVPEIMLYLKILHLDEPMDLISSDLNLIPSDSIIPESVLRELA